jgi:hypothetical protein
MVFPLPVEEMVTARVGIGLPSVLSSVTVTVADSTPSSSMDAGKTDTVEAAASR